MTRLLNRAVFLDRDGVINAESDDFIKRADELTLLHGAAEAIGRLTNAGWLVIVVTNQSGIGRGLFGQAELLDMHEKIKTAAREFGGHISAFYACTHLPEDSCPCRKPRPDMILWAARDFEIDLSRSWLVGDRRKDIQSGQSAGCRTILALSGKSKQINENEYDRLPDLVVADLAAGVDHILSSSD